MWTEPLLLAIFGLFPARSTIFKPSSGRPASEYDRASVAPFFRSFGLNLGVLAGKRVLDLGSGFGSQAIRSAEAGGAQVVGLEVDVDKVVHSRMFALEKRVADRVSFVCATGESLPFAPDSFDVISMDDVLEHVIDPGAVIEACYKVP